MNYSAEIRHDITFSIYQLTSLVLNLKLSKIFMEVDGGTFENCTALIFNLGTYEFKCLNKEKLHSKNISQIHIYKLMQYWV